ncbi:unnamed protein product [Macrosiphum euphorbiae]|uniref:Uncharacterized protein n=1 Tax=Macrosiphum euphorbiae TaxID=13131 RepID=A0AAV0X0K6_9HEMI|nr:unnamed protein product [Macrosiphum euphorbiae]
MQPYIIRSYGDVNLHIAQFLKGHGCFGSYMFKFKKLDTQECHDCQAPIDDPEYGISMLITLLLRRRSTR